MPVRFGSNFAKTGQTRRSLFAQLLLRSAEDVEKHRNRQTCKDIDQRPQDRHGRNQSTGKGQKGIDEINPQQNSQQKGTDQRQRCCILERHGRSMDAHRQEGN